MWQIACFNFTSASDEADINSYWFSVKYCSKYFTKAIGSGQWIFVIEFKMKHSKNGKIKLNKVYRRRNRLQIFISVVEIKNLPFISEIFWVAEAVGQWNSKKYWKRTFNILVHIGSHRSRIFLCDIFYECF